MFVRIAENPEKFIIEKSHRFHIVQIKSDQTKADVKIMNLKKKVLKSYH